MKPALIFLISLVILLGSPLLAGADGFIIETDYQDGSWRFAQEEKQEALIVYERGWQRMILTINLASADRQNAVWIFPVPADAHQVSLDVLHSVPRLDGGLELNAIADSNLESAANALWSMQFYPVPFILISAMRGTMLATAPGVEVHDQVDKEGVVSEVVSARSGSELFNYLRQKGLSVSAEAIPVLDDYIGQDYSFVASWVSYDMVGAGKIPSVAISANLDDYLFALKDKNLQAYNNLKLETGRAYPELGLAMGESIAAVSRHLAEDPEMKTSFITFLYRNQEELLPDWLTLAYEYGDDSGQQRGVLVNFPTDQVFFPLKPTSVYGDAIIPIRLRILGNFQIASGPELGGKVELDYWRQANLTPTWSDYEDGSAAAQEDFEKFYQGSSEGVDYTRLTINGVAASEFSEDLRLQPGMPVLAHLSSLWAWSPIVVYLLVGSLAGTICGLIVSMIFWRRLRWGVYIGLANLVGLPGALIAIYLLPVKPLPPNWQQTIEYWQQQGLVRKRRLAFVLLVLVIPAFFLTSFSWSQIAGLINWQDFTWALLGWVVLSLLPFVLLGVGLWLSRIKAEHRSELQKLKNQGFSTWTFNLRQRRRIYALLVFSGLFVVVVGVLWWLFDTII